ncbi:MAG: type II toxin-antitoxin system RelE/ParE family toxin [Gammaproteobacteria bacterium]|nr:type II toxin-antitoxin system RelE/ParE family toxin [Gammaproteobacteria bacterium]
MAWKIKFDSRVEKSLKKLDRKQLQRIRQFLDKRIANSDNPRQFGKALTGELSSYWRYRVGNYRILCEIQDQEIIILVIEIDHRSRIYRK